MRGFSGQEYGSGHPSVKPTSGDRLHGYRVQGYQVQSDPVLDDRVSSNRIHDSRIHDSRICIDRSNLRNWFIDLPNLGQFLIVQDRWHESGRYGNPVLKED